MESCVQISQERDALSGQIAKLTSERDNALSECKSLREELARVKEDYHKRDLAKYTENLARIKHDIEIRAVDLFKQSPAFNALTFAHFVKGVEACRDFLFLCGEVKAAGVVDAALNLAIKDGNKKLKAQVDEWCTDCKSNGLPILPMHVNLSADPRTTYGSPQPDSPWLDYIPWVLRIVMMKKMKMKKMEEKMRKKSPTLRRYEAAMWLSRTVGVVGGNDLPAQPSKEEFRLALRRGIVPCNVLNKIQPGAVPKD
ncbi:hypothetical protein Ddye_025993 [Dipteronia dyeriana]|uniref:Uncharacterized protein n=1 Tax=Dipteronia dyeriana TaxID=168575 RepID=A0AAD9TM61_9ROSI|nr:hypothetical protein Ddye_025993 [Dipteronia dyeriana]